MSHPPDDPRSLLADNVRPDFLAAVLRLFFRVYAQSYDHVFEQLDPPEARMELGNWRRAMIESHWRQLAKRFDGVTAESRPNQSNTAIHTLIVSNRVHLTESKVDTQGQMVQYAIFRDTYARDNQGQLWGDPDPPHPGAPLYGIVTHSPSNKPRIPLFVDIGFPTPDCVTYVDRVQLFSMFPEIVHEFTQTTEEIEDVGEPDVRPDIDDDTGSND